MTPQLLLVFGLLLLCMLAFILNRPRMDAVALIALVLLVLTGVLSASEAFAGFSDPSVLLIAAFFVIGEGLVRTGVAYRVGDWLVKQAGQSETRLLVLLMVAVAGLGSVMSSTGVVAIFIPVALSIAARLNIAPARLMMPLSFAGLMSGMLTLVATPPNLVVNSELMRHGETGFGFFSFTPLGLMILLLGVVYMLFARRWLGQSQPAVVADKYPRRRLRDLVQRYQLSGRAYKLQVLPGSPLVGRTLGELQLRTRFGANVIGVERERHFRLVTLNAGSSREIRTGDVMLVDFIHAETDLQHFCEQMQLQAHAFRGDYFTDRPQDLGLAEVVLPPDSAVIGKTLLEVGLRSHYGLYVVGLRRNGEALADILDLKLKLGDSLLVAGAWKNIRQLQANTSDFLVLSLPAEVDEVAPAASRAPFALLVLVLTVGLMISGLVPNVVAAFIGCLLMGAFRCIDLDSAYRSIHWQSLILIIGMLPFATALQKTGGIDLLVGALLGLTGDDATPRLLLATLFVVTAVIGLFISNTATAVLMAPIAVAVAYQVGVSPLPFAMTVAVAASAAFMTPVSSPVNTLVLGPGQYRFMDYVKVGVPFTLLVLLLSVWVLPWLFPFYPA